MDCENWNTEPLYLMQTTPTVTDGTSRSPLPTQTGNPPLETPVLFRNPSGSFLNCDDQTCSIASSQQDFVLTCDPGSCVELMLRDITGRGCLALTTDGAVHIEQCPDAGCTSAAQCAGNLTYTPGKIKRQAQSPTQFLWRFPPGDSTKLQSIYSAKCVSPNDGKMGSCGSTPGWTVYDKSGPVPTLSPTATVTGQATTKPGSAGRVANGWAVAVFGIAVAGFALL